MTCSSRWCKLTGPFKSSGRPSGSSMTGDSISTSVQMRDAFQGQPLHLAQVEFAGPQDRDRLHFDEVIETLVEMVRQTTLRDPAEDVGQERGVEGGQYGQAVARLLVLNLRDVGHMVI